MCIYLFFIFFYYKMCSNLFPVDFFSSVFTSQGFTENYDEKWLQCYLYNNNCVETIIIMIIGVTIIIVIIIRRTITPIMINIIIILLGICLRFVGQIDISRSVCMSPGLSGWRWRCMLVYDSHTRLEVISNPHPLDC